MILQETIDNETRTYSSDGLKIRSLDTGCIYDEAYDPAEFHRQYEETNIPIVPEIGDGV